MKRFLLLSAFFLAVLGAWQLWAESSGAKLYLFPSPQGTAARALELVEQGILLPSIGATLQRVVSGFLLAGAFGLLIGLLMATQQWANIILSSTLFGLQTLPSAAWVPIALLLFGLRDSAILFVVVINSLPAMAVSISRAFAGVDPLLVRAAQTLGTSRPHVVTRVLLPASVPALATALKIGWNLAWHGAVTAELIRSSAGLGFLLYMGRELNDAAQVVAVMLITIAISVLVDRLIFTPMERRLYRVW